MSDPTEIWASDGLPSAALESLTAEGYSMRRFPLVGGMTVWDDPPAGKVIKAVACPNRLGVFEPLAGRAGWDRVWWWSDPLSPDPVGYGSAHGVERRIPAPVTAPSRPGGHPGPWAEARDRSLRAAHYLTRRLRHLRGVRIPSVSHGRRFPLLLPVNPASVAAEAAEEFRVPRPVNGWPGLVVCEVGWWQSTERLDALADIVRQMVEGEPPAALGDAERTWSSPAP